MSIVLLLTSCFVYAGWRLWQWCVRGSPLDNLPGPPQGSFLLGNINELSNRQSWKYWRNHSATYGPVAKVSGFIGMRMVSVYDPKALYSVLTKDVEFYPKHTTPSDDLPLLLGPGLFTTNGEQHRKQRKALNPVFSAAHLRSMTHIFYDLTRKVQRAIGERIGEDARVVDIDGWMARTTLEMLGQAGLGYSFDDFQQDSADHFGESLKNFFPVFFRVPFISFLIPALSCYFPEWTIRTMLRWFPHPDVGRVMEIADTMAQRSKEIIDEKRRLLLQGDEAFVQQVGAGKDLMSILLRRNMAASEAERLSDPELVAQLSTFTLAGMDTTSNALCRVLHLLAERPEAQGRLRTEILEARATLGTDDIPYDDLVKLPYLDAICRETLRLYAPVTVTVRRAAKDMALPVSNPIRGQDGSLMNEVPIPKGTFVIINCQGSNCNREWWGEDVYEWRPERWMEPLPPALEKARVPGIASNLMTFVGGPRSCIGFKFSELEMKVVVSVLVASFKFELTDQPIMWNSSAVTYPTMGDSPNPEMLLRLTRL
ncbi:cytochrome P450 [Earliella scabrosa]|nr:cytochrome P450 [Earliella scabrosa]